MREALDNVDEFGGVDDLIGQTSSLYLSDDYKEVKDHVVSFSMLEMIKTNSF